MHTTRGKLAFCLFLGLLVIPATIHLAQAARVSAACKPPFYVLVAGPWHGGWAWQRLSAKLRAEGAGVYTPSLSGLAEHRHRLDASINLDTHITDLVNLLVLEDLHEVVPVGHSYAGNDGAGVADQAPERLRYLVFLDALLLENGQSVLSVQSGEAQAFMAKASKHWKYYELPTGHEPMMTMPTELAALLNTISK